MTGQRHEIGNKSAAAFSDGFTLNILIFPRPYCSFGLIDTKSSEEIKKKTHTEHHISRSNFCVRLPPASVVGPRLFFIFFLFLPALITVSVSERVCVFCEFVFVFCFATLLILRLPRWRATVFQ